jgi:hypothetical protein
MVVSLVILAIDKIAWQIGRKIQIKHLEWLP